MRVDRFYEYCGMRGFKVFLFFVFSPDLEGFSPALPVGSIVMEITCHMVHDFF